MLVWLWCCLPVRAETETRLNKSYLNRLVVVKEEMFD